MNNATSIEKSMFVRETQSPGALYTKASRYNLVLIPSRCLVQVHDYWILYNLPDNLDLIWKIYYWHGEYQGCNTNGSTEGNVDKSRLHSLDTRIELEICLIDTGVFWWYFVQFCSILFDFVKVWACHKRYGEHVERVQSHSFSISTNCNFDLEEPLR